MNPPCTTCTLDSPASSRRDFIKTMALGAGVTAWGAGSMARDAVGAERKVVVGGHPWVYVARQPNHDITPALPEIFADMSYAGVDGVELMYKALVPDDALARIGELSARHRLPVIGTTFNGPMWDRQQHAQVLATTELVVSRLAKLGGRTLGTSVGALPPGGPKVRKSAGQLDAQAELLARIITVCADHGVELNLHNHTYEVENGLHDLGGTLARLPDVKLGPDLNWLVRGGVNPVEFIRRYRRQIVFLHLRDQHTDGRWSEALGEGDTDFVAIASALREIGFSGHVVIELAHEKNFTPTRPLRESIKLSREFVRKTFGY